MAEINQVMGATGPPLVQGQKQLLDYPGIKFVFFESTLQKLQIFNDDLSPTSIANSLCFKKCRVLLNHGIQIEFENEIGSMGKRIFFG